MDMYNVLFNLEESDYERLSSGAKGRFVTLGDGDRYVAFIEGPGQGGGTTEPQEPERTNLPPSDYDGDSREVLSDFTDAAGKPVRGRATRYGSVVITTTKPGSHAYARLFTADGYQVGSGDLAGKAPVTGRVRQAHAVAKELAKALDWTKLADLSTSLSQEEQRALSRRLQETIRDAREKVGFQNEYSFY